MSTSSKEKMQTPKTIPRVTYFDLEWNTDDAPRSGNADPEIIKQLSVRNAIEDPGLKFVGDELMVVAGVLNAARIHAELLRRLRSCELFCSAPITIFSLAYRSLFGATIQTIHMTFSSQARATHEASADSCIDIREGASNDEP
jgi:hypothetical protein